MTKQSPLILRAEQIAASLQSFSHPWNSNSQLSGSYLGRTVGLKRTGVNFVRIPPGKESFIYHAHYREEEWIYILSGHGVVEINEEEFEVDSGDFVGFPTPSVAHHLRNTGKEDLIYLMGGENLEVEIADFPHLKKRVLRHGETIDVYDFSDAKPFGALDP